MYACMDNFYSLVVIEESQGSFELVCDDKSNEKCQSPEEPILGQYLRIALVCSSRKQ